MKYLILLLLLATLLAYLSTSDSIPNDDGYTDPIAENHDTLEISVPRRALKEYHLHDPGLIQLIDEIGLCSEAVEDDWGVWLDQPAHINGSHYHCFATTEFASYYFLDPDAVLDESNNLGNCGHNLSLWTKSKEAWDRVLQRCGVVDSVDITTNPCFFLPKGWLS